MSSGRKQMFLSGALVFFLVAGGSSGFPAAADSLFNQDLAESTFVRKLFAYIDAHKESIVDEWIGLTEVPAPSGHEQERARIIRDKLSSFGLEGVSIDEAGNVSGTWSGSGRGKTILVSAHMDTVFQDVWEIRVKREGDILKAPGVGDDTAGLINLLWTVRALKQTGFSPLNTYVFLATVGEETGFVGMKAFLDRSPGKFDHVLALDGDLGKVHYGALGFGGGTVVFRGPGAHTMQSRGVPDPNLALAMAVERIRRIPLPSVPLDRWTILNVGMIRGGKVRNAVSQESSFTIDLRSASQDELEKAQEEIRRICRRVAREEGVSVDVDLNEAAAHQIPGAGKSLLVRTVVDILHYLGVRDIEVDPLGSTEANEGIARGIISVNLGRTYGRFKHSLREEAEIEGLFLALKQVLLLVCCLERPSQ